MKSNQNDPNILNDLIKINNDRIEGYKLAVDLANEQGEGAREAVFNQLAAQSEKFIAELSPLVELAGQYATDRTKLSGELFRLWMVIRSKLSGGKMQSLLEQCERGEAAFSEVYEKALAEENKLSIGAKNLIQIQLSQQREAHENIKILCGI
ncbi:MULTISPECIES: PA2169 family four-helix-bundle protein [Sphingobacterium]|uniref:PA2169 family four-helix-bundle protein n=1 Tax=Sphingobacterium TaxID=28453 RepID=UPI00258053D8|nr:MULTISPECIES: PA2169 family four-helix-bundle protein [Sphingobacterium]